MSLFMSIAFFMAGVINGFMGTDIYEMYTLFFLSGIFAIAHGLIYIGDHVNKN